MPDDRRVNGAPCLHELRPGADAVVAGVVARAKGDPIAARLADLGFVAGEPVRVVARGPLGGDPLVVQVGYTRFALRRAEAARVVLRDDAAERTTDG